MRCSSCDHDNRANRRFCAECGAALTAPCAACGASNQLGEKFCGECGRSLRETTASQAATPPEPAPAAPIPTEVGERRQLTIVFSDLVGSTQLSTQLDPEEWRDRVSRYHHATADVVIRFGGTVAKYLGDGMLTLFGYPQAHEDDAERAVRAGLGIIEAVRSLEGLSVRIGIHTGLTVIGDAGGTPDVFGETPNVAARVQGAADPDTVVVSGRRSAWWRGCSWSRIAAVGRNN